MLVAATAEPASVIYGLAAICLAPAAAISPMSAMTFYLQDPIKRRQDLTLYTCSFRLYVSNHNHTPQRTVVDIWGWMPFRLTLYLLLSSGWVLFSMDILFFIDELLFSINGLLAPFSWSYMLSGVAVETRRWYKLNAHWQSQDVEQWWHAFGKCSFKPTCTAIKL